MLSQTTAYWDEREQIRWTRLVQNFYCTFSRKGVEDHVFFSEVYKLDGKVLRGTITMANDTLTDFLFLPTIINHLLFVMGE